MIAMSAHGILTRTDIGNSLMRDGYGLLITDGADIATITEDGYGQAFTDGYGCRAEDGHQTG